MGRHIACPSSFAVRKSPFQELSYVVAPCFLDAKEIATLHALGQASATAQECTDRDPGMFHRHEAHRFEKELRQRARPLYRRLMGVMQWADREVWGALGSEVQVYP